MINNIIQLILQNIYLGTLNKLIYVYIFLIYFCSPKKKKNRINKLCFMICINQSILSIIFNVFKKKNISDQMVKNIRKLENGKLE